MPKVNLAWTYGYRDPATGQRKFHGPGKDIEVPQGLVDTLGLTVIADVALPEEVRLRQSQVAEDLPGDFPGRKFLMQAGHATLDDVVSLSIDDLIEINGIGTRLAEKILERVNENT